ncbi:hypothetical protein [Allomuricauda sp. NBRC 101325]|uniref:hypothetical protein n=1 Tax=Allomuricauda sp. NBRC 101325 TaxID=1113758 RepID=UPI0024A3801C|nr:hypothetical protein [Muricauda sp. NBRC 101325]GLU45123.1 hypothetical protein Musp01_27470 [Muricauda sp. NBRC 101325]
MKTILRNIAVLAITLIGTSAFANGPVIDLSVGNDPRTLLFATSENLEDTQISLMDSKEEIIHFDKIGEGNYQKRYNLKNLQVGTYFFKVNNRDSEVTYSIVLDDKGINKIAKNTNMESPVLRISGDKVYFNLFNEDQGLVKVKIRNGNNEEIDSQVFNGELTLGKVFNFQGAYTGDYTVIVEDGKHEYRKTISVQ